MAEDDDAGLPGLDRIEGEVEAGSLLLLLFLMDKNEVNALRAMDLYVYDMQSFKV